MAELIAPGWLRLEFIDQGRAACDKMRSAEIAF
jgi:hypothetical protein